MTTTLSIADRGFRFGDGVFETIPVYSGVAYQLEWHLQRLKKGLKNIRIEHPAVTVAEVAAFLRQEGLQEGFVRIAISRGVGSQGYLPTPECTPTIVMEALPRSGDIPKSATLYLSQYRKIPPQCLPVESKLAQGLNSTLARMEAQALGCFEALQLTVKGELAEGSSANLLWVENNTIYTPPVSLGVLEGSTRAAIMRLASVTEIIAPLERLKDAQEIFLTNCNWGVLPVISLQPQAWQWPIGPKTRELQESLRRDIAAACR